MMYHHPSRSIQLLRCQVQLVQTCCLANARSSSGPVIRSVDLWPGDVSPVTVLDSVTHSDRRPIFPHKKRPRLPEPLLRTADTLIATSMLFRSCSLDPYIAFGIPSPTPHISTSGGDEGTRTPGLLRAREALSQLSYIPASDGPQWIRTIDLSLIRGML
jgi:hypothetical protein